MENQYDIIQFLTRQKTFSENTFGTGNYHQRILAHIKEELAEIEEDPNDPLEWIDVILLAFDQLLRMGYDPVSIACLLEGKLNLNEKLRKWPDYRNVDLYRPIHHVTELE